MATPLNSYSFSDSIRASGRSCDYEYFLIPVLFVKGKEMVVKKFTFFFYCVKFLLFSAGNLLWIFWNSSRRN